MRKKPAVIVVGSSGGIGAAICSRLVARCSVIGVDLDPPSRSSLVESFFEVDLREADKVAAFAETVVRRRERYWGLVYCAGVYPIVPVKDYSNELWDAVQAVNVRAAFQLVRQLSPRILEGGRVVLVSSGAAYLGSRDTAYSVSKAGMLGMTRSLARNLAPRRILVNAVCPGPISTPMSARMSPKHRKEYVSRIPLHRFGQPAEVAVAVEFLLDPENTYMTGTSLDVSGGLAMH
jgi:NAD(P)-dependent dehydrogenase (short-subunit alcohol dehydrogenase family)